MPAELDTRRGHAFGVAVEASFAVPQLSTGEPGHALSRVRLVDASPGELKRAWPAHGAGEALRRSRPDGRLVMLVERHPDTGYSVWAPRFGRHLVSSDGTHVGSAIPRIAAWRWERLLFAQVLPLASALQGREMLHASAVSLDGRIAAFVGTSGAGKSSVAAHLVDQGATLVTDDVLAVVLEQGRVVVHPGTRLMGVDPREVAVMRSPSFGERLGRADKAYVDLPVSTAPGRLAALYFLTMGRTAAVVINESTANSARLLGARFFQYLSDPAQLVRHLDVCAAIARGVPTFDVLCPPTGGAVAVAEAVHAHLGAGTHGP